MQKYTKFNEIKNKIFLDALSKSDVRWDGKQEFFYMALSYSDKTNHPSASSKHEQLPIDYHVIQI